MARTKRIAVLTGGGDAPGLNAAIYAVVRAAAQRGWQVFGVRNGFDGFWEENGVFPLDPTAVDRILNQGGTILGTINRGDPFRVRVFREGQETVVDVTATILERVDALNLDAVVVIGGDGTLRAAWELYQQGFPAVGVPKTIDNDVPGTEQTIGFATAVETACQALDRVQTTAAALRRILVVELMGRNAGFLALHAGLAGGADVILLPEFPFDYQVLARHLEHMRRGRGFSLIAAAEGAHPQGGQPVYWMQGDELIAPRLGGIARVVAQELERRTGIEARWMVLGYLQRGGPPNAADRLLALRFGTLAVEMIEQGRLGTLVGLRQGRFQVMPLEVVHQEPPRRLSPDDPMVQTARRLGVVFGEAG